MIVYAVNDRFKLIIDILLLLLLIYYNNILMIKIEIINQSVFLIFAKDISTN